LGDKYSRKERGTGVLEMVMFLPVALILLFLFFDCGLRYYQNSVANDLLRGSLNDASMSKLLRRNIFGNKEYSSQELETFVDTLAKKLSSNLQTHFLQLPGRRDFQHLLRVELHQASLPPGSAPLATSELGDRSLEINTSISPPAVASSNLRLSAMLSAPTKGILPQNPLNQAYFQIDTAWAIGLE